ncbi:hypothetical protein MishRS11D_38680 [Methylomagnum ishizawai]|nr:hypothetical protein MishRS11D_38680 [Methylomagnum ishizawai]
MVKFNNVDFFNLREDYVKNPKTGSFVTDAQSMVITLDYESKKKSIRYVVEYWTHNLSALDKAIRDAVNPDAWLYPAPDPWESGCIEDQR